MKRTAKLLQCAYVYIFFALSTILLWSCGDEEKHPDVSDITVTLQSQRLDKDLAALDTNNLSASLYKLKDKYPLFLDFYLDTLMGFDIHGVYSDTAAGIEKGLRTFLTHPDYRGVFDTVAAHYPSVHDVDEDLIKGYKYMKHYYPDFSVPRIIYLVSGLNNWGAFSYSDTIVGIGLDMFLGENYPFYKAVGIPDYRSRQLQKDYIPVAVFMNTYRQLYSFILEDRTLLDMMIQRGKEQYFLQKIIPFVPEHVRLGYTEEQYEWLVKNEEQVYNFFVTQKLLYDNAQHRVLRYVTEGPTSTGMPPESPGNVGTFIGWQIVKAYAEKNGNKTMQQILESNETEQVFLQASGYKPRN